MKHLIIVCGPMGVGKTTVCNLLKTKLPACVFLDGDWCWDMHPFVVNQETKNMVLDNIAYLLNQFLRCSVLENILFCWVIQEQSILDSVIARLSLEDCHLFVFALVCSPETLVARIQGDISQGLRTEDCIQRSLQRLPLYQDMDIPKIITDGRTVQEIAQEILNEINRSK